MKNFLIQDGGKQTTIARKFQIKGKTLINNKKVLVNCLPAKANTGIIFNFNNFLIKANIKNVSHGEFNTTQISRGKKNILTIEHIMSAFYGIGVDNVIIELIGDNQLPILDGSGKKYAQEISRVGIKKLSQNRKIIKIIKPFMFKVGDGSFFCLSPYDGFKARIVIEFNNIIGCQSCSFDFQDKNDYYDNICSARTFLMKSYNKTRWKQFRKNFIYLPQDYNESGIIAYNSKKFLTKLRYKNEPARHKMLDFIGDFSLLSYRLKGEIFAYKPGHNFNQKLVKEIFKDLFL